MTPFGDVNDRNFVREWLKVFSNTAQKMKFSTKDFFSKSDHIRSFCAEISFFVQCKW